MPWRKDLDGQVLAAGRKVRFCSDALTTCLPCPEFSLRWWQLLCQPPLATAYLPRNQRHFFSESPSFIQSRLFSDPFWLSRHRRGLHIGDLIKLVGTNAFLAWERNLGAVPVLWTVSAASPHWFSTAGSGWRSLSALVVRLLPASRVTVLLSFAGAAGCVATLLHDAAMNPAEGNLNLISLAAAASPLGFSFRIGENPGTLLFRWEILPCCFILSLEGAPSVFLEFRNYYWHPQERKYIL